MQLPKITRVIALSLTLTLGMAPFSHTAMALTVIDPTLIAENIFQRILAIEQWAQDNSNQLDQINKLDTGNTILDDTQTLMEQNYAMDFKASWDQVMSLQEDSLALLHAAKSVWEEFGSAQQYYASFHKAQAWEKCMQSSHCNFATALNEMDNQSIEQALQAYQNAEDMNVKLQEQIDLLQELNTESQNSESAAGTIDTLSKINGHVASSMVDLNNQIAQLTKMQSHEMAQKSNEDLAHDSYIRAITSFKDYGPELGLPYELP